MELSGVASQGARTAFARVMLAAAGPISRRQSVQLAGRVHRESRQKLYGSARAPECMEIEYPEFPGSPAHALRVLTTSRRGGKLHIEFTIGNLDIEGCASPQPRM